MAAYTITPLLFTNMSGFDADPAVFDTEFQKIQASDLRNVKTDAASTMTTALTLLPGATGLQAISAQEVYNHTFAANTVIAFFQATAPTGWVQVNTHNDAILRVVNNTGVGGSFGGLNSISVGISAGTTGGHSLIISEMPAHTHTVPVAVSSSTGNSSATAHYATPGPSTSSSTGGTGAGTNGVAHTHTVATWHPKYIDMIICAKQ